MTWQTRWEMGYRTPEDIAHHNKHEKAQDRVQNNIKSAQSRVEEEKANWQPAKPATLRKATNPAIAANQAAWEKQGTTLAAVQTKSSKLKESVMHTMPVEPPQAVTEQNWYSKFDNFLHGWLPGGVDRTEYKTGALREKTEQKSEYYEAKDEYETMKQNAKLRDQTTDTEYVRQMEQLKKQEDLEKSSWYELFGGGATERALRDQRTDLMAQQIAMQNYQIQQQQMSNPAFIPAQQAGFFDTQSSSPISEGIGTGMKWALPIGVGAAAFMLLKK